MNRKYAHAVGYRLAGLDNSVWMNFDAATVADAAISAFIETLRKDQGALEAISRRSYDAPGAREALAHYLEQGS